MTGDPRMFNSINTNGNDGYDSITFGDNGKGKVKRLGKIAISKFGEIGLHGESFPPKDVLELTLMGIPKDEPHL